jgi:Helix-turn-helix domain
MRGDNTAIQNVMVLEHLLSAPITPIEALNLYGCFRLAARIYDLRQAGNEIITMRVINGEGNPYAEYHLLRQAQRAA